jgi:hypothetical protein
LNGVAFSVILLGGRFDHFIICTSGFSQQIDFFITEELASDHIAVLFVGVKLFPREGLHILNG